MYQNAIREWMIIRMQPIDGVHLMRCHMISSNSRIVTWSIAIISRMDLKHLHQHQHQHHHCHIRKIIEALEGNNNQHHHNIHSIIWTKDIIVKTTTITTTMLVTTSLIRRYNHLSPYQIDRWTRVQMDSTSITDQHHPVDRTIVQLNRPISDIKANMSILSTTIIGWTVMVLEILSNRTSKVEINHLEHDSHLLVIERGQHLQEVQVRTQTGCIASSFRRENNSKHNRMIQWISRTDHRSKITLIMVLGDKQEGILQAQLAVGISSSQIMLASNEKSKGNMLRNTWIWLVKILIIIIVFKMNLLHSLLRTQSDHS